MFGKIFHSRPFSRFSMLRSTLSKILPTVESFFRAWFFPHECFWHSSPKHATLHYLLSFVKLFVTHWNCYTCYMVPQNGPQQQQPQQPQQNPFAAAADKYNTSLGLQEYNPSTPPGWKPGLKNYPFRKYLQKMQLWNTIKACSVDQTGPLVAGRLCGAAFQIAMHLQITRSDGTSLSGADAISCPDISATTGNAGDKSGGGYLVDRLIE